ncbi:conserved hypothetical protein, partial [Ricinus communis]
MARSGRSARRMAGLHTAHRARADLQRHRVESEFRSGEPDCRHDGEHVVDHHDQLHGHGRAARARLREHRHGQRRQQLLAACRAERHESAAIQPLYDIGRQHRVGLARLDDVRAHRRRRRPERPDGRRLRDAHRLWTRARLADFAHRRHLYVDLLG